MESVQSRTLLHRSVPFDRVRCKVSHPQGSLLYLDGFGRTLPLKDLSSTNLVTLVQYSTSTVQWAPDVRARGEVPSYPSVHTFTMDPCDPSRDPLDPRWTGPTPGEGRGGLPGSPKGLVVAVGEGEERTEEGLVPVTVF